MTPIEFFTHINPMLYLFVLGGILIYLLLFVFLKSTEVSSLSLALFYLGLWLWFDFTFDVVYFAAMPIISWAMAFSLSLLVKKDYTTSTLSRAVLAASKKSIINNVFEGILVSGSAGSGKSLSVIYPLLKHYAEYNFSGILYDYKDFELTELAYPLFENSKVNFKCLCFHDVARSSRINPLASKYINSEKSLKSFFEVLYTNIQGKSQENNPFFKEAAISSVSALAWKLHQDDTQNCNLPFLCSLFSQKSLKEIASLINSNIRARHLGSVFLDTLDSSDTIASIKGTISRFLGAFSSPEEFYVLLEDTLDLALNNPESPTVLSFINEPSQSEAYSPLIAAILSVTLKKMSQRDKNPSFLVLDEAPTLKLPNISRVPATMRSFGVSTLYCMQDKTLSDEMQGDITTRAILANLSTMYIGKANDPATARMYEELCTQVKEKQISLSASSNWFSSKGENRISTSTRDKPSIHKSEFFTLKTGEFYHFSRGKQQKITFPLHQPSKKYPPIVNSITPEKLESLYNSTLERAKAYPC